MSADGEDVVPLPHGSAVIAHSAQSDVGRVRSVNEDAFLAEAPVYLVADGMGGHARGDAASRTVIETFRRHLEPGRPTSPEQVLDAIHTSNEAVRALSAEGEEGTAVAGTTLTGVALVDAGDGAGFHWMVFNIGDSRVYSWDGRTLEQLSVDHSAVQELVDAGLISADEQDGKNAEGNGEAFAERPADHVGVDQCRGFGRLGAAADQAEPDHFRDVRERKLHRPDAAEQCADAHAGFAFKLFDKGLGEGERLFAVAEKRGVLHQESSFAGAGIGAGVLVLV